jgi:two-component system CheB/CheR fusion protein
MAKKKQKSRAGESRQEKPPAPSKAPSRPGPFPIVGIGASAGGFEAFADLLRHLPADPQMAFVLVQHLDPSHGSLLSDILSRAISLPVSEVTDGEVVQPGHVYAIPANTTMLLQNGVLRLERG